MTSDGYDLLTAILVSPEDDLPRLVYADWLDDQGGQENADRAAFIRVQVELDQLSRSGSADGRERDLRAREQTLLTLRGAEWLAPLRAPGGPLQHTSTHGVFRRGFVEVVWMPAPWFVRRASQLFSRTPARELRVIRSEPHEVQALFACPYLGWLDTLDLSDRRLGDDGLRDLCSSGALPRLGGLRLRGCNLTDDGAFRLVAAGRDWRPRELDVSHNPIGPTGVAALRARFGDAVRFITPPET